MRRDIVQNGHPVLREIAKEVTAQEFNTSELNTLLQDMSDTLSREDDGVALAAPQIAISKRIFVVSGKIFDDEWKKTGKTKKDTPDIVFINPFITKKSNDKKLMQEGCLSVRPLYGDIRRASRVTISYQDEKGVKKEMTATGLLSEIFQHEIDHLDGILFIDNAKNIRDPNIKQNA